MIPTPASNTILNAMSLVEQNTATERPSASPDKRAIPTKQPAAKRPHVDISATASTTTSPYVCTNTSGLGALARLAPETRNTIYSLLFSSPSPFVVPTMQTAGAFKLRE